MARAGRPASESYQPVCCSVRQSLSTSSEAGIVGDEDEETPIFSLSKSSMDVVMATGPPHKRDPTWTTMDLKRSSSTNTHSDQKSLTLQQLHHKWRHNSHQLSFTTQNKEVFSPPPLSERWISNMHRWSGCSSSHSRSSTPDTVVWKGGSSRPCSVDQDIPYSNQDIPYSSTPDSSTSKLSSSPTTPSPLISPFQTPTLPPVNFLSSSCSPLMLSTHQLSESSPHPRLTSPDDEGSQEKFSFQFPSPVLSPVFLEDAGEGSDPGCLADDVIKGIPSPGSAHLFEGEEEKSPLQRVSYQKLNSPAAGQESTKGPSSCYLGLPLQAEQSYLASRSWRLPLVSSLSDSQLDDSRKCKLNTFEGTANALKVDLLREEATMTSQLKMVDAAVQTVSPLGSCSDLGRKMSTSNTGSHSVLGSPPGSRLNLKSPVGSHSNLVSPSSSMFPASSSEEEENQGDDSELQITPTSSPLERRSCLKIQLENRNTRGRRSSMKQVQWDEDGLTWEIHGASMDPDELNTAIQKHLKLKNSPKPEKSSIKKKKAPKPPVISNLVTTMALDITPPAMSIKCMVEGESQDRLGTEKQQGVGGKQDEAAETACVRSQVEQDNLKDVKLSKEEGISNPKSQTHTKKKTVIRSLRRPGWCGGSRKKDD